MLEAETALLIRAQARSASDELESPLADTDQSPMMALSVALGRMTAVSLSGSGQ